MSKAPTPPNLTLEAARQRLRQLGLYGLLAQVETLLHEPWFSKVLDIEDAESIRGIFIANSRSRRVSQTR